MIVLFWIMPTQNRRKEAPVGVGCHFKTQLLRRKSRLYFRIRLLWPNPQEQVTSCKNHSKNRLSV